MTPKAKRRRGTLPWIDFYCGGCDRVVKRQASKFTATRKSFCANVGKVVVMRRAARRGKP